MSLLELARQGVMSDKIIENLDPLSMQSFAATYDELKGLCRESKEEVHPRQDVRPSGRVAGGTPVLESW